MTGEVANPEQKSLDGWVCGVAAHAEGDDSSAFVTVRGDAAASFDCDTYSVYNHHGLKQFVDAVGVGVEAIRGGTSAVDIQGNIIASSAANSFGIAVNKDQYDAGETGTADISVGKDIISTSTGRCDKGNVSIGI